MSPFIHFVNFASSSSIHNQQSEITEAEALILCSALQCVSSCVLLVTATSQTDKLNEVHDSRN
jgi:hypothetical protein